MLGPLKWLMVNCIEALLHVHKFNAITDMELIHLLTNIKPQGGWGVGGGAEQTHLAFVKYVSSNATPWGPK